jgi:hypothetical protein
MKYVRARIKLRVSFSFLGRELVKYSYLYHYIFIKCLFTAALNYTGAK